MAGFILMIAVVVVCVLIFGKADSKREILQQVGLDLSESNYEAKKQQEFEKYCIKALNASLKDENYKCKDESSFLRHTDNYLSTALWGDEYYDDCTDLYEIKYPIYIDVKKHYIEFARDVVGRRIMDIKDGNVSKISCSGDFSDKSYAKRYIRTLWEKYQYPWPKNWKQQDGL